MRGEDAPSRAAVFSPNNRLVLTAPVDEAARAWWLERFFEPHGLTSEGMGDAIAALTDPVPSLALRADGRSVTVPLGQALVLDAVGDRSGKFDVRGEGRVALAEAYVGGVADE